MYNTAFLKPPNPTQQCVLNHTLLPPKSTKPWTVKFTIHCYNSIDNKIDPRCPIL